MKKLKTNCLSFLAGNWPLNNKKPTVFFIHGAGQTSLFWKAQIIGLTKFANTIAIDLPGHGDSLEQNCNKIEDYANSVITLLNTIKPNSPILCGLSMGGAITQHLLITKPDMFKLAILINTGAKLKVLPKLITTAESNYSLYVEMFLKFAIAKNTQNKKKINDVLLSLDNNPRVTANDLKICDSFDMMKVVHLITTPTLIITAKADLLTPIKYGQYLAKQINCSLYASINSAGHMSPIEKPALTNDMISNFIF